MYIWFSSFERSKISLCETLKLNFHLKYNLASSDLCKILVSYPKGLIWNRKAYQAYKHKQSLESLGKKQ